MRYENCRDSTDSQPRNGTISREVFLRRLRCEQTQPTRKPSRPPLFSLRQIRRAQLRPSAVRRSSVEPCRATACAGCDRVGRCLHRECERQGVATFPNLSDRAPSGTAARAATRARDSLCRISDLRTAESPPLGFAAEDRLFHLTTVVSQNGFQLSTRAMNDRLFALRLFARAARKGSEKSLKFQTERNTRCAPHPRSATDSPRKEAMA